MEADKKSSMARVACTIPNGLAIQLMRPGPDDGTGHRPMVRYGDKVVIAGPAPGQVKAVETEVDAKFLDEWLRQNEGSGLVDFGAIKKVT